MTMSPQLPRIELLLRAAENLPEVVQVLRNASDEELVEELATLLGTTDSDLIQVVRDARLETFRPTSIARLAASAVELRQHQVLAE